MTVSPTAQAAENAVFVRLEIKMDQDQGMYAVAHSKLKENCTTCERPAFLRWSRRRSILVPFSRPVQPTHRSVAGVCHVLF